MNVASCFEISIFLFLMMFWCVKVSYQSMVINAEIRHNA